MVSLKFLAASMRSSWSKGGVRKLEAIFSFLKNSLKSGFGVDAGAAGNLAVLQLYPAAHGLVLQLELRDAVTLFQARCELRIHGRACAHGLRDTPTG
jgi:hypothetical protein